MPENLSRKVLTLEFHILRVILLRGVVFTTFSWIVPLGSLAFRAALVNSLLTSFAAGCLYFAARQTLLSCSIRPRHASLFAVATTWTTAGSMGWWFQAIRPEVYALEAALIFVVIERLVTFESTRPTP